MKWIRFIVISVLVCLPGYRARACSDYYTSEMCNMFSVYNHNDLYAFNYLNQYNNQNQVYVAQFNFWKSYFRKGVTPQVIQSAIFNSDAKSLNVLIRVAQQRKDADGLNYLRLFKQMQSLNHADPWSYPDKKQQAADDRVWNNILANASGRILTSGKLGSRYWLMAIRAAYYTQKKQLCLQYWDKYQSKFSDRDIRMLAEGYPASYWYKDGEREKAREFYAGIGDLQSLRWCFKDDIGLKGIQKLYAETPNSVAFPYLIQDYVNSVDNDLHTADYYSDNSDSVRQAAKVEMKSFRTFVKGVLKENKVLNPALWKSAAAYFAYLLDDSKTALKELDEAEAMKGTDRMKENIRVLRFFVKSDDSGFDASFDAYALKELKWLMGKVKSEPSYLDYGSWSRYSVRNHYSDALERIVYYHLTPGYLKSGRFNTGAVLTGMTTEFISMNFRGNKRSSQYLSEWKEGYYSGDYSNKIFELLDSADVKDVVSYKELLETPAKGNELEQTAVSYCRRDMNYYNDLIGTKYLRTEDFAKAGEYLSKVSLSFMSACAIAPYLHADNSYPMWYAWKMRKMLGKRRFVKAALTVNPKLVFSTRMLALQQRLNMSTDDKEKAQLNYELAERYLQASHKGYCWAYLHYGWSVDSTFCAQNYRENYLEHAKICLQKSMQQNPSVANKVNCLFALASLADTPWRTYEYNPEKDKDVAVYHTESSQAQIFKQLYDLRSDKEFVLQGLSRCDNLKSYLDYNLRR